MRTSIILSALIIAKSIDPEMELDSAGLIVLIMVFAVMDLIEWMIEMFYKD